MRKRYPKHESRASYLKHRRTGTHERTKSLYRGKDTHIFNEDKEEVFFFKKGKLNGEIENK